MQNTQRGFIGAAAMIVIGAALAAGLWVQNTELRHNLDQYTEKVQELEELKEIGAFNPVGGPAFTLSGSGVSATADTVGLTSFKTPVSNYPFAMSDFGTIGYLTLEPGNSLRQEFVSFTGVTQNADGSATLTGVTRGLSPVSPYTASTTIRKAHAGGSQAALSNSPAYYSQFTKKANDETITGQWTFDTFPITPASPAASETAAGISEIATQAEAVAGVTNGTLGRLVIPASMATSTYATTTAPSKVVMTRTDGSIDLKLLGTTTVALYPTASVSHGTTTIGGSVTLTGGNSTSNIASTSITSFTSSTTPTTTWTKRSNLKFVIIEVQAGGGGGGAGSGNPNAGSGGAGGGYCKKIIPASALGSTETVTVGGAGAKGTSGGNGGSGGPSSFGSHCTTTGGAGGSGNANSSAAGGTATSGDLNIPGEEGGIRASTSVGGAGGNSFLGRGGGGGPTGNTPGTAGHGYGAGGGGSNDSGTQSPQAGDGSVGAVFVWEVYF